MSAAFLINSIALWVVKVMFQLPWGNDWGWLKSSTGEGPSLNSRQYTLIRAIKIIIGLLRGLDNRCNGEVLPIQVIIEPFRVQSECGVNYLTISFRNRALLGCRQRCWGA